MRTKLTITRASRLLQTCRISPQELCLYCYNIASFGENVLNINAFQNIVSTDSILEQAEASEDRIRNGKALSLLDGIPISIKANIAVQGLPFTASSKILGTNISGYDSYVAQQLVRRFGAILIGHTNMDEFGMGSLGTNILGNHVTKNPLPFIEFISSHFEPLTDCASYPFYLLKHNNSVLDDKNLDDLWTRRIRTFALTENWQQLPFFHQDYSHITLLSCGGSSCGSAASVAMGSSLSSIGSDTGGSVRLPAAWCGIVGLKPSYGLISRHGLISYASSLDSVGVLSPSITCASIMLDHLAHKQDEPLNYQDATAVLAAPTSAPRAGHSNEPEKENSLNDLTVGIPSAFSLAECPPTIAQTWQEAANILVSCGAKVQVVGSDIISPHVVKQSLSSYYILACAEASSNLARYDGLRYGPKYNSLKPPLSRHDHTTAVFDNMSPLEQTYAAYRAANLGPEVVRRILCGTAVLSTDRFNSYYESASYIRQLLIEQFCRAFGSPELGSDLETQRNEPVDCIIIPTVMNAASPLKESQDSIEVFANDLMTVPSSLAGLPSISIHLGNKTRETSLQIIGPKLSEKLIIHTAHVLLQEYTRVSK